MRTYLTLLRARATLFVAALLAFPLLAIAQTAPVVAADPITEVISLIGEMFQATGQWKALGWVAALAAILRVLVKLTNTRMFDNLVGTRPWIKPAISSVLGVLVGVFGSLAAGVPLVSAILAGLIAGLTGTGLHELLSMFNKAKQAERAAGAKLGEILVAGDADALAKFKEAMDQLDDVVALPMDKRLVALAAWANGNPVAPPPPAPPVSPPAP